jgi:hypothetical protein
LWPLEKDTLSQKLFISNEQKPPRRDPRQKGRADRRAFALACEDRDGEGEREEGRQAEKGGREMKNKKPKPRVMWAIYDPGHDPIVSGNRCLMQICEQRTGCNAIRVAVIPLDDVEAIVERAAKALCNRKDDETWGNLHWDNHEIYRDAVSVALAAAGIPCRKARK